MLIQQMLNMCIQSSSKCQQLRNIHSYYNNIPPQKSNSPLALEYMAFQNRSWIVFQLSSLPGKLQLHSGKKYWWFAARCFFAHQIGTNSPPTSTHHWPEQYPHDFQTLPTQVISRFLSSYFSMDTSWNIPDIPQGNLFHTLAEITMVWNSSGFRYSFVVHFIS